MSAKNITQIYAIGAGHGIGNTYIKIGITAHCLRKRLAKLQVGCPFSLVPLVICEVPTLDALKTEKDIHTKFAEFKTRGEWFLLNDESELRIKEYFNNLALNSANKLKFIKHLENHKRFEIVSYCPD